jgi:hypothetical protein
MKKLLSALFLTSTLLFCRSPSCDAQHPKARTWQVAPCNRANFKATQAPTECLERIPLRKAGRGCIHREFEGVWREAGGIAREYIYVIDNGNEFKRCLIRGHIFTNDVT